MKREEKKKILSTKSKIIFAFLLGITLSGTGVYAAVQYMANEVSFTSSVGLKSTNVQDAIDEVYGKAYNNCPDNKTCNKKICKRATELHTITCENDNCGYKRGNFDLWFKINKGDTITYGRLGSGEEFTVGDAFDCDVNGDGVYDSETERFYYVSDYYSGTSTSFKNEYAVLIYYKDYYTNGVWEAVGYSDTSTAPAYPGWIIKSLTELRAWRNIKPYGSLTEYNRQRTIFDENGKRIGNGYAFSKFENIDINHLTTSEGNMKNSRVLTYQELNESGCIGGGVQIICPFLLENISSNYGYWLETINSDTSTTYSAYEITSSNNGTLNTKQTYDSTGSIVSGIRPVIEIPKSNIDLGSE